MQAAPVAVLRLVTIVSKYSLCIGPFVFSCTKSLFSLPLTMLPHSLYNFFLFHVSLYKYALFRFNLNVYAKNTACNICRCWPVYVLAFATVAESRKPGLERQPHVMVHKSESALLPQNYRAESALLRRKQIGRSFRRSPRTLSRLSQALIVSHPHCLAITFLRAQPRHPAPLLGSAPDHILHLHLQPLPVLPPIRLFNDANTFTYVSLDPHSHPANRLSGCFAGLAPSGQCDMPRSSTKGWQRHRER